MADLNVTTPAGFWSQDGVELILQSLEPTGGGRFAVSSDMLFVVFNNSGATEPIQFVAESEPHPDTGRTGDIDVLLESGEMRIFRLTTKGWADSEGYLNIPGGQSEDLLVGVIKLRSG